jgi:hypothetical protein
MTAERLMLFAGLLVFVLTLHRVRQRDLREVYCIGWMTTASLLFLIGIFPDAIKRVADWAQLSYPAAVLFGALGIGYVFAFSVTLTLSRHHRQSIALAQQVAFLEQRL